MNLKEYLDKYGIKKYAFAHRAGIGYNTLHHHITRGMDIHLSVATAIVDASEGQVTYKDLAATVVPVPRLGRHGKAQKSVEKKD